MINNTSNQLTNILHYPVIRITHSVKFCSIPKQCLLIAYSQNSTTGSICALAFFSIDSQVVTTVPFSKAWSVQFFFPKCIVHLQCITSSTNPFVLQIKVACGKNLPKLRSVKLESAHTFWNRTYFAVLKSLLQWDHGRTVSKDNTM